MNEKPGLLCRILCRVQPRVPEAFALSAPPERRGLRQIPVPYMSFCCGGVAEWLKAAVC